MDHFYQNIHGWSNHNELNLFRVLRKNINSPQHHLNIAEVGVWRGRLTAMWIVELINEKWSFEFHSIDLFDSNNFNPFPGTPDPGWGNNPIEMVQKNLSSILDKVNLIQCDSSSAALRFPDNYFDIVYIDANHTYESVKKDIEAWLPKIKHGGYLSGDDYNKTSWPGVVKAVNELLNLGETWGNDYPKLTFWADKWIYKVV